MTREHLQRLQEGRARSQAERRAQHERDAVERVSAFRAWVRDGSPPGGLPLGVPRNADFKAARRATGASA